MAALGPDLALLLAPSSPARRSGLATPPGKATRFSVLHDPPIGRAKKEGGTDCHVIFNPPAGTGCRTRCFTTVIGTADKTDDITVIGTSINMPLSVLSLVLLTRTPAGGTSLAVAPLLRHEHAILVRVGPYRDGKHDPTSPQCVEAITLSIQPEGGMRAVDKSPVDASGSSAEPAFKTTGSREFFLPIRSPASRFKGRAQPEVPAACREGPGSTGCLSS